MFAKYAKKTYNNHDVHILCLNYVVLTVSISAVQNIYETLTFFLLFFTCFIEFLELRLSDLCRFFGIFLLQASVPLYFKKKNVEDATLICLQIRLVSICISCQILRCCHLFLKYYRHTFPFNCCPNHLTQWSGMIFDQSYRFRG